VADQSEARREQIAAAINGFTASVGAPAFLKVKATNITLTDTGASIRAVFGDVIVSVEVGEQSLAHLLMIHGFLGAMGGR
jgi:hypothetical protein